MSRVLVITDAPRTSAFMRFAFDLLQFPHDVVDSLAAALDSLKRAAYDIAIVDLRWDGSAVRTLASWVRAHVIDRGLALVLTPECGLARDLECAVRLPAAVLLRRGYDLLDLKEACAREGCHV